MNVNWLKICSIGLKVLLAVGTGVAVFSGISRATGSSNSDNTGSSNSNNNNPHTGNSGFTAPTVEAGGNVEVARAASNDNTLATGLRATQGSLEKIIAVIGSLAMAAESIGMLFGKSAPIYNNQNMPWGYGNNYGNNNYYGGGGWMQQGPQPQAYEFGHPTLVRETPFVMRVESSPRRSC